MNRKNGKVDEKIFRLTKMMTASGATREEIAECFGISPTSVTRIRKYDTYEEYHQQTVAIALEYRNKQKQVKEPEPVKEPEKPVERTYMPYATQIELVRLLKEQNETLKLISNKLVFIVEQLA